MAFELKYNGSLLLVRFYDVLDAKCLRDLIIELGKTEDTFEVTPHRLIDLSDVEKFELNYSLMVGPAENRKTKSLRNPIKAAFVAPNVLSTGLSRMFISLSTNPKITYEVFKNKPDAEAWLAEN